MLIIDHRFLLLFCFITKKSIPSYQTFYCLCSSVRWFCSWFSFMVLACKYLLLQTAQERETHRHTITFQQAGCTVCSVLKRYLRKRSYGHFALEKTKQLRVSGALLSCVFFFFFFFVLFFILVFVCWGRSQTAWMALANLKLLGKNSDRSLETPPCLKVAAKLFPSGQFPAWSEEVWPWSFPSDCTLRKRTTDEIPVPLEQQLPLGFR